MDLARAPRRTARKKGSGYENDSNALRNYWGLRYSALLADFRKGINIAAKAELRNSYKILCIKMLHLFTLQILKITASIFNLLHMAKYVSPISFNKRNIKIVFVS